MIFQDSGAMMNPIRPIGVQFREYLALHGMTDEKKPTSAWWTCSPWCGCRTRNRF